MKYMTNGGFQKNPQINLALTFSMVFLGLFWLLTFVLFISKLGFTPESIANYYRGSAVDFQPARNVNSMLEVSHGHAAMMVMVLLLITHLVIFTNGRPRNKRLIIIGVFSAGIINELSSWAIRFLAPSFALVKLVAFLSMQGLIFYILLKIIISLRIQPKVIKAAHDEHIYDSSY